MQTLVRGVTFPASAKAKTQTSNSICCLTTGSVQEKYANKADVFVDQSFMKNTRQILQVGDVVISSANSKELVGKSILWEDNSGMQKTFGGFLTVARVKDSQSVIPEYLFLVYRYMFKTGYFANLSTQTTNIANLSNKLLDSLAFPIAPLAEQKRIATQINQLFEQIDCAEKAYKELSGPLSERFRQLCLEKAIQGKLVPQLESEPEVGQIGEIPEDVPFLVPEKWKWCNFGNVVAYGKCEQVQPQNIEEDAWILDLEDIESGTGNLLQKKKGISVQSNKSRFKKGDVLYSKLRPYLNKVIVADDDGYCTTEIVPISLSVAQAPLEAQYLKIYLMSPYFVGYANQCSYGVKMPRLGTKDAKKALFPIPPIEEQRRIVAKLNELLGSVSQLERTISTP